MLETARQNSIVSYAGLSKPALITLAKQAFAQADFDVPERFSSFLPLFPFELIQNMNYLGHASGPAARVSPLGFSRDPQEYHAKLYRQFPDLYQGDNYRRNFDYEGRFVGRGVFTVDPAWTARFPQFAPFAGEKLMIHLIGGGHQAVALPESLYPRGRGLLSAAEKSMQITQRVEQFAQYVKGRVSGGELFEPELFAQDYLTLTGLSPVMLRQSELGRILQDLSIAKSLENDNPSPGLFTENARRVEHLHQYVPFLYACDTFEPTAVTKHTARLFQPAFSEYDFISNLWIPYQDLNGYMNRETMTLDMQRLCEGYQIAPVYDPATGGGRYPDTLRGIIVRDRDILMLLGDVLNNPAYGSGMNPLGMIGKQVFIPDSRELIRQRKLALEELDFAVDHTLLSPEAYHRALMRSALQEYKGNLVDAMYRREAALSQMEEDTYSYETSKASLDEKAARKQARMEEAAVRWKHGQVSGYDADIDYLRRKQQAREGVPQEEARPPMPFAADPQREQSIESGYTMRNNAQRFLYRDVYVPQAQPAAPAVQDAPPKGKPEGGKEPSPASAPKEQASPSQAAVPKAGEAVSPEPGQESAQGESTEESVKEAAEKATESNAEESTEESVEKSVDKVVEESTEEPIGSAAKEALEKPLDEAADEAVEVPRKESGSAREAKASPRPPASLQALSRKLASPADPSAPKLAHLVPRDDEPAVQVDNKDGKMATLVSKPPKTDN